MLRLRLIQGAGKSSHQVRIDLNWLQIKSNQFNSRSSAKPIQSNQGLNWIDKYIEYRNIFTFSVDI